MRTWPRARTPGYNAIVDLWGGGVVQSPEQLTAKQPVAPLDYTKDLQSPLLGLFGNDDQRPSPADVDKHEEELKKQGKKYEFHRYDGAGPRLLLLPGPRLSAAASHGRLVQGLRVFRRKSQR